MYIYIVHTKITLHIQILIYCKKCYYQLDYGPTQNWSNPLYTAKKNKNVLYALHDLSHVLF